MRKRSLFHRFIPFVLCLLLAACAGGSVRNSDSGTAQGASDAGAAGEETGAEAPVPDGALEIDFWMAGSESAGRVMQEIIDEFNGLQETWFIRMTLFESDTDLYNEVQMSAALQTLPDFAILDSNASAELYRKNQTVDLTAMLESDPGFKRDNYSPVYFNQGCAEDGTVFAMAVYGRTKVMFYNKEAFARVKIDPEQMVTWEDVAKAAYRLQQRRVSKYGWELYWGYENMLDAALSNGGTIYSEDGRTVTINTPEWVEVWEQFRVWMHEENVMRVHSGGAGDEWLTLTQEDVTRGDAGGYTGSSWNLGDLDREKIGLFLQPKWDPEKEAAPGAYAYLFNLFAASGPAEREGAQVFLRYLTDVPAQVKWTTGTGYIAANRTIVKDADYQAYSERYPEAVVLMKQSRTAQPYPPDPTGDRIKLILRRAADKLQIENLPAKRVLDDAQSEAQRVLDEVLPPLPEDGDTARETDDAPDTDAVPGGAGESDEAGEEDTE